MHHSYNDAIGSGGSQPREPGYMFHPLVLIPATPVTLSPPSLASFNAVALIFAPSHSVAVSGPLRPPQLPPLSSSFTICRLFELKSQIR